MKDESLSVSGLDSGTYTWRVRGMAYVSNMGAAIFLIMSFLVLFLIFLLRYLSAVFDLIIGVLSGILVLCIRRF